uniref:Kinase D-interacting substrate n=1 Tax=Aceria tosichella TaxID=561515 RepID=A0A6G1SMC3_9ACAR
MPTHSASSTPVRHNQPRALSVTPEGSPKLSPISASLPRQFDQRVSAGPLIYALESGDTERAKELIRKNIGLYSLDEDLATCEMIAVQRNNLECLELLLERSINNINATDLYGWTSLMYACYYGYSEITKRLLLAGAQADLSDNDHMSALVWASGRGHTECVTHLLQLGHAKVNQVDKCGTSPLVWACRKGFTDVAAALLKAGANIDCTGMFGWSALLVAVLGNHIETLRLLLQHKPNVNTCDVQRHTPLIAASKEGRVEIVKLLLKARAFVNLSDEYGNTALTHAAKGDHVEIVDILIKHHANIDHVGVDRKSALFWAVEKGNQAVVERLLHSRPNLELTTRDGETCLIKAVKMRRANIVQLLLAHHARVTATDKNGDTILHIAVKMRSAQIIQIILTNPKNHILLNKQNKDKKTPMMLDSSNGQSLRDIIFALSSQKHIASSNFDA